MDDYFNEYEPIDMAPDDSDMYAVFPENENSGKVNLSVLTCKRLKE